MLAQTAASLWCWPLSLQGEPAVPEESGSFCSRWTMQILKIIIRNYIVPAVLCCMSIASVDSISRARRTYSVRRKWGELTEGCEITFTTALFSRHGIIQNTVHFLIPDWSICICIWQVFHGEQSERQGGVRKDHVSSCNVALSETVDRNVELFHGKQVKKPITFSWTCQTN